MIEALYDIPPLVYKLNGCTACFLVIGLERWAVEFISYIDNDNELKEELAKLEVYSQGYFSRIEQSLLDNMRENDFPFHERGHSEELDVQGV